jgi:tripartite-type tricarboxylate transporter receptor subunit TctC
MLFTTHVSAKGQLDGGKLRAVAVASATRSSLLPAVPTFAESGYPVEFGTWFGLLAPANTPPAIVHLLYSVLQKAGQTPEFRDKILGLGGEIILSSPESFKTFVAKDVQSWKALVKTIGNADLN